MYNNLFSIGPLTIHAYGLFTAIGILAAYFSAYYRAKKKNLDPDQIFGLVVSCVILGYLGSKLLYLITILPQILADPAVLKDSLTDGWVVYGGILGGILGGWLFCRWKKLSAWKYFDLGLASVALAQGFGRIGCFFAGCCYGEETSCPIGIVFTHSDFAPNGVALVPTQLFSALGDFLLFAFLLLYDKKWKKKDGEITGLYLILYSLGRFIIEFWRGDLIRGQVGILSTSQFIGLFTLAAGVLIFLARKLSVSPEEKHLAEQNAEEEDLEKKTEE